MNTPSVIRLHPYDQRKYTAYKKILYLQCLENDVVVIKRHNHTERESFEEREGRQENIVGRDAVTLPVKEPQVDQSSKQGDIESPDTIKKIRIHRQVSIVYTYWFWTQKIAEWVCDKTPPTIHVANFEASQHIVLLSNWWQTDLQSGRLNNSVSILINLRSTGKLRHSHRILYTFLTKAFLISGELSDTLTPY